MKPQLCAVIPARGGSKGILHKNLRPLAGKSLIAWSVEAARGAACVSRVVVSTDSWHIAEEAVRAGAEVPCLRPSELAGDCSPVLDAVVHLLATLRQGEQYEPDYLLLLQPTSPLRTSSDIEGAFAQMQVMQADAVVSVCAAASHPYLCRSLDEKGRLRPFIEHPLNQARRQELPPAYVVNGALYLIKTSVLLETGSWMPASCCGYVMPEDCSVDIDTMSDLERAEWLLMRRERGPSDE